MLAGGTFRHEALAGLGKLSSLRHTCLHPHFEQTLGFEWRISFEV